MSSDIVRNSKLALVDENLWRKVKFKADALSRNSNFVSGS